MDGKRDFPVNRTRRHLEMAGETISRRGMFEPRMLEENWRNASSPKWGRRISEKECWATCRWGQMWAERQIGPPPVSQPTILQGAFHLPRSGEEAFAPAVRQSTIGSTRGLASENRLMVVRRTTSQRQAPPYQACFPSAFM
jgi:hypothetical protein